MNKHTAQLPDGSIATRNSKTRTYTHVVAGLVTAAQWEKEALGTIALYTRFANEAQETLDAAKAGDRATDYKGEFYFPTLEAEIADLEKRLADACERVAKAQADYDAATFADRWVDLGWCGRLDLAMKKVAQSHSYDRNRFQVVKAFEATIK